jgi:hypothetical protein
MESDWTASGSIDKPGGNPVHIFAAYGHDEPELFSA